MRPVGRTIREVHPEDDFEALSALLRANGRNAFYFPLVPGKIRSWFFGESGNRTGYVAETEEGIRAFLAFDSRGLEGVVVHAIHPDETDAPELLSALLEPVIELVRSRGGAGIGYFAFTEFGQLRTPDIALMERIGFRANDEYIRVSTKLLLRDWEAPDELELSGIAPEPLELETMYSVMVEDGNASNATIFLYQFQRAETRNVILAMRGEEQELAGFAYYKVVQPPADGQPLLAAAFNAHFRPHLQLSRSRKRDLIRASLQSMEQLGVTAAHSLLSLSHPDIFTLLMREGFEDIQRTFYALRLPLGE